MAGQSNNPALSNMIAGLIKYLKNFASLSLYTFYIANNLLMQCNNTKWHYNLNTNKIFSKTSLELKK